MGYRVPGYPTFCKIAIALNFRQVILLALFSTLLLEMNIELNRKALEKVGNPHILVNLVSRRVRQISSGGGGISRPLVDAPPTMDLADIALLEIIEEKVGWESTYIHPEHPEVVVPKKKRAQRKSSAAAAAAAAALQVADPIATPAASVPVPTPNPAIPSESAEASSVPSIEGAVPAAIEEATAVAA